MKKYLIVSFICILTVGNALAQQENNFSLFNRNALYYNPGFTGMEGFLNIGFTYRKQWTGFDDAPSVYGLNAHGRISKENTHKGKPPFSLRISNTDNYDQLGQSYNETEYTPHAIGGYVLYDKYHPYEDITAALSYAYHLQVSEKFNWSVGAALGFTNSKLHTSGLEVIDPRDPTFRSYNNEGVISEYNFNFGLGTVFYSENLYVSYSIKQFLNQENFKTDTAKGTQLSPISFIGAGYNIAISSSVELYPSVLFKYQDRVPLAVDFLLKSRINNTFIVGAGYRREKSVLGLVGFNLNNSFNVTYSYGFQFGDISGAQSGNHSINLNVALFNWSDKPVKLMW